MLDKMSATGRHRLDAKMSPLIREASANRGSEVTVRFWGGQSGCLWTTPRDCEIPVLTMSRFSLVLAGLLPGLASLSGMPSTAARRTPFGLALLLPVRCGPGPGAGKRPSPPVIKSIHGIQRATTVSKQILAQMRRGGRAVFKPVSSRTLKTSRRAPF
jgi:hypothetical protein